ncbi:MAG TPA: acyl-homoserine-lactone synthase [Candidatus Paceibacterota bacterium]|nr:acyl-homoserine-lactone synthase [Candidatus Paceibacterota bacterium]
MPSNSMHFQVLRATNRTSDIWRKSVHLQRQVYCRERGFESLTGNENPERFDRYDVHQSKRVAVVAKNENRVIATARIISPTYSNDVPAMKLQPSLANKFRGIRYVESSGFCSSKEIKQSLGLTDPESGKCIMLLLIAASIALGQETGATHAVMVIEQTLFRILKRLGIPLTPFGDPVEYHGTRRVYYGAFSKILSSLKRKNAKLWEELTHGHAVSYLLEQKQNERYVA